MMNYFFLKKGFSIIIVLIIVLLFSFKIFLLSEVILLNSSKFEYFGLFIIFILRNISFLFSKDSFLFFSFLLLLFELDEEISFKYSL